MSEEQRSVPTPAFLEAKAYAEEQRNRSALEDLPIYTVAGPQDEDEEAIDAFLEHRDNLEWQRKSSSTIVDARRTPGGRFRKPRVLSGLDPRAAARTIPQKLDVLPPEDPGYKASVRQAWRASGEMRPEALLEALEPHMNLTRPEYLDDLERGVHNERLSAHERERVEPEEVVARREAAARQEQLIEQRRQAARAVRHAEDVREADMIAALYTRDQLRQVEAKALARYDTTHDKQAEARVLARSLAMLRSL